MKMLVRAALWLSIALSCVPAAAQSVWADGSVPQKLQAYSSAEVQVSGLSGGDTMAVSRSLNCGQDYFSASWVDNAYNVGATIVADGLYSFPGNACLKWTKTGSASTPTVIIRGGN